jgi:hypothetical protein
MPLPAGNHGEGLDGAGAERLEGGRAMKKLRDIMFDGFLFVV